MPSLAAKQAMYSRTTDQVALALLTVNHPSLAGGSLYVVNNTEPIISGGHTHVPAPFGFQLPKSGTSELVTLNLVIFDFTRAITEALEGLSPPEVTSRISVIRASAPNTVERDYPSLRWTTFQFDQGPNIRIQLQPIYDLQGIYPSLRTDAIHFPGLF